MRCPTCGTDNETDSRFCGGCGARIGGESPRLAPTHKITDDAPYPPPAAAPATATTGAPVSYAPPSLPPVATPVPGSVARAPQVSSASLSFTVPPSRPLGLVVALLVVDLGLAAAGAVLLGKGLADDEPASDAKAQRPAAPQRSEASAAPATQIATAPPAPPSPPAASSAAAAPRNDAPKPRDEKKAVASPAAPPNAKPVAAAPSPPRTRTSEPQDPYSADTAPAVVDTAREIDAASARSKASFEGCARDHAPVQGSIEIAFQVRPDGRIANAAAVANSTGSSELARCLVAEIAAWRVSAHDGEAISMSRPFTYR